ncbi:MAG: SHOCT domain-containing protein [Muribaculaceae bacterium]|nr:SHOCT domain-containing protein [Muribaculaceae bacterium]
MTVTEQIAKLKTLLDAGALTQKEFGVAKNRILDVEENPVQVLRFHSSMVNKIKAFLILAVLMFLPSGLSAQQISVEDFWRHFFEAQSKIDLIRQGLDDATVYFELDDLKSIALQTPDPQAYLDYALARYNRTISLLNKAGADWAEYIANYYKDCQGRVNIDPRAMQEGIVKYTDMKEFFLYYSQQEEASYHDLWKKYSEKYGNTGREYFRYDNEFMKQYEVYVYDE